MTPKDQNTIPNIKHTKIDDWFGQFIHEIQTDQFLLKEGIASEHTKNTYEVLMSENVEDILKMGREAAEKYFFRRMIIEYVVALKDQKAEISRLAFDLGSSKVLSWVVIKDNDEESEDKLIMAEAKVNAQYHPFGFHLSTTIIEDSDNLPVPSHYNEMELK